MPPWLLSVVISTVLVIGVKWMVLVQLSQTGTKVTAEGAFQYLIMWAGMDAKPFFQPRDFSHVPSRRDWLLAIGKVVGGAVLIWGVVRAIPPDQVQLRGWTAVVGLSMMVHFGLFELSMLQMHAQGFQVIPFMRRPFSSTSLTEFWGTRWNTAFHYAAFALLFQPFSRRSGPVPVLILTFLVSGIAHELAMSLPAGGIYGVPVAYFLAQAGFTLFQRSRMGKRLGLNRGRAGRWFTITVFLVPMAVGFLSFPFFSVVLLPLLHAVKAI